MNSRVPLDPGRHLTVLGALGLGLVLFFLGLFLGYQTRTETPRTVATCPAKGWIGFEPHGDRVAVRCAP